MSEKNYKDTLNIGVTSFEMKANLITKEKRFQDFWFENKIYDQALEMNNGNESFVLHDGPPYANGNIHVGHALNKILKDFIVRWRNSLGYYSPLICGWDTHGLPIEVAVTKSGVDRKKTPKAEFRNICKKYALDQISNQISQFSRLGVFTNYEKKYVTLNHNYEMSQIGLFIKMVEKGLVYHDLKPIYWSPTSETALAEAEIEYQDVSSPTIFVSCEINDTKFKNTSLVIWTTTPWTIPSNQLIAVGQDINYVVVKPGNDERNFVIAEDLVEKVSTEIGWENIKIVSKLNSSELVGIKYKHPWFNNKEGYVVIGHHVTVEAGSGLVHIAGGFGEDDFLIVKNNGLEPFVPINDQGLFDKKINDSRLEGLFYEDANKIIGQTLDAEKKLLKLKFVKHSYPHDWRTKKPIIYRATNQWFVSLEPIKDEISKVIDNNVATKPNWSKERLKNIILDRKDWTISRQRLWGVPIIAFYDENKEPIIDIEILNYAYEILKEKGTNAWFEMQTDDFLPEKYRNRKWSKERDILDVWFDSGCSNINLEENFNLKRPYDVYLEGNDQYRGWFNSSLIISVIYDGKAPYKTVITHGMTNDEKGRKMSKSIGNTVDPLKIADDLGADILRLWVASTDYTDDQRIGNEILKQVSESYRKIRNTIRFLLANLYDFDKTKNMQEKLEDIDLFVLSRMSDIKEKIIVLYNDFQFNNAIKNLMNFIINDLSSFYLDFIKDILYVEQKEGIRRRQVQTVLYHLLLFLIDVLRPIIPHTVEEIYMNLNDQKKVHSVHLLHLVEQKFTFEENKKQLFEKLLLFSNNLNEALEIARNEKRIKKGFEAEVNVCLKKDFEDIQEIKDIAQILIVSKINFVDEKQKEDYKTCSIFVKQREGFKCERCWGIFDTLINNEICERCHKVINK